MFSEYESLRRVAQNVAVSYMTELLSALLAVRLGCQVCGFRSIDVRVSGPQIKGRQSRHQRQHHVDYCRRYN